MTAPNSPSAEINLVKFGLDFTATVLNASNSSNPLVNGAIEVGQWLGWERLNRLKLAQCFTKAKGLAFPNEAGQQFCEMVKEGTIQNPLTHRFFGTVWRSWSNDYSRSLAMLDRINFRVALPISLRDKLHF